jgi:hypothetical protein
VEPLGAQGAAMDAERFDVDAFIDSILGPITRQPDLRDMHETSPASVSFSQPSTTQLATIHAAELADYWQPLVRVYDTLAAYAPTSLSVVTSGENALANIYYPALFAATGVGRNGTTAATYEPTIVTAANRVSNVAIFAYQPERFTATGIDRYVTRGVTYDPERFGSFNLDSGPFSTFPSRVVTLRAVIRYGTALAAPRPAIVAAPANESSGRRAVTPESVRERFTQLADRWSEETQLSSVHSKAILHRAYQQIIALGPVAVPLILERLRDQPDHWFWALTILTDEDPAEGAGSFVEARDAWLRWGRNAGYPE